MSSLGLMIDVARAEAIEILQRGRSIFALVSVEEYDRRRGGAATTGYRSSGAPTGGAKDPRAMEAA